MPFPGNPDQRLWFATPLAICFTGLKLANAENLEKLVEYTRDVAQTLAKLHAERKWHRDLKPENLFILNGVPVIGDFGLVDFPDKEPNTRASENLGSRNYTAPELEGDAGDVLAGPADVYSLAKTLWTLASGKAHPPPGHLRMDTEELRFSQICTHQRALSLDHLIERSTTHSLTNRPTMESFASELSAWLTQPTKTDSPTSAALSPDHKALFEMERRTRLAKEQLIQSASAIISFFQPVLQEIAQAIQSAVLVEAHVGKVFHLEHEKLPALFQAPQVIWSDAVGIRATVGEDWITHSLQTFVQVEAIEDDSIRVVAGHFVEKMARGERLFRGVETVWRNESRAPHSSAKAENDLIQMRDELQNNLGAALQRLADEIMKSKKKS